MKTKERQGVDPGNYNAKYKELIRPGNKVGLKETGQGDKKTLRLMYRLVTAKGEELAASVSWDKDDIRGRSGIASLGVDPDKVYGIAERKGIEAAILYFDKTAKAQADEHGLLVNCYVREKGGFASGLRPVDGDFILRFVGVTSLDETTKKPVWKYVPAKEVKRGKESWTADPQNTFTTTWMVASGPRKGVLMTKNYHYAIVKDEDDEWVLDAESKRGGEFRNLLVIHGIPTGKLRPDRDFKTPENGLPELDAQLKKAAAKVLVQGTVKGSWLNEIKAMPEGLVPADAVSVSVGDEGDELKAKLVEMIQRRVMKSEGKPAFLENGAMSKTGFAWMRRKLGKTLAMKKINPKLDGISAKQTQFLIDKIKERYPLTK